MGHKKAYMATTLHTADEVAGLLNLHVKTIRRYIRDGRLKARRIGKDTQDSINFEDLLQGVEEEREGDAVSNDMLGISLSLNK